MLPAQRERQRAVVREMWLDNRTIPIIATRLGISRSRVKKLATASGLPARRAADGTIKKII